MTEPTPDDTLVLPATNQSPPRLDLSGRRRDPDQWQPAWIVKKYFTPVPASPSAAP